MSDQLKTDIARRNFKECGLTYKNLTKQDLKRLRIIVAEKVKESGLMKDSYRVNQRWKSVRFKNGHLYEAYFECKAFYFTGREAISFNRDGFIGFCGWSDSEHQAPILAGFYEWLEEMTVNKVDKSMSNTIKGVKGE